MINVFRIVFGSCLFRASTAAPGARPSYLQSIAGRPRNRQRNVHSPGAEAPRPETGAEPGAPMRPGRPGAWSGPPPGRSSARSRRAAPDVNPASQPPERFDYSEE